MNSPRTTIALAALSAAVFLAPQTSGAQRTPPQGGRSGAAAQRPDTGTKPPLAQALDYQNQELGVVFNALAEAANLNITMSAIPATRVTVRMARGATRDTLVSMIRTLAEANNVRFTAQGSLIRLEGDPNASPAAQAAANQLAIQQAQQQAAAANQLRLFTYRLRHASAVEVAPVLMNLLGGAATTVGGVTFLPGGGVQFNQPGGAGNAGRGNQPPAAPGRGGVQTIPPVSIEVPAQAGRGNAANQQALIERAMTQLDQGGRGGRGGGAAGQAIQQLLAQQLGLQGAAQGGGAGVLSNTAAQIRIVADVSTNSLLIRASTADYALIQSLVQTIDLRPLQVLIEVTIAEVQRSSDVSLGIGGTATRKGATANAPRDTVGILPGNPSARDFILQLAGGNGSINYRVALNALESRGNVKVLSLPVIIAQNNKQAVLNVGEQRPFVQVNQSVTTGSVPTTVQTVQYIPVGTTLTITPTINADGYVNMAVDQTNDAATNEVAFDAPVISKRQATTQIFLKDGQTTVIGGLAGNNTSKTTSGIPILSRIPWLGALFGNTTTTTTTNELFLFLTPHIISSDEDIERFREALQGNTDLLKDVPLGPRIVPPGDSARIDSLRKAALDTTRRRPPSSPFKK